MTFKRLNYNNIYSAMLQNKNDTSAAHFSVQTKKLESGSRPLKVSQILQGLISSNHLHDWAPTKADMETLLYVTKKHEAKVLVRMKAFKILEELTANKTTAKSISLAGGAKIVIEVMEKNPNHMNTQDLGCTVLAQLATVDDESVKKAGGVKVMRAAMEHFPDHVAIQISACKAVSAMTMTKYQADHAVSLGFTEPLLKFMEAYPNLEEAQALCWEVLANLSFPRAGALGIGKRGGIKLVIDAMKWYPSHVSIQQNSCKVLQSLVNHNWDFSNSIVDAGGITCIVIALQLHADHETIQEYGYRILSVLSHTEDGKNPHKIFCEMIVKELEPSSIMNAMKKHRRNDRLQVSCLRLSLFLMLCNSGVIHSIASSGGITLTLSAMRNHPESMFVQHTGLFVLSECAHYRSLMDRIVREGGIDCVLNTMRCNESYSPIQYSGCFLLNQFSRDAIVGALTIAAGGIECVSTAMENYANDARIQEEGSKYFSLARNAGVLALSVAAAAA